MASWFSSGNYMPVEGRTVLLTGATQGMGLKVATMLSARGANVVIVARGKSRLEAAVDEMKASAKTPSTQRFHAISADVTSVEENNRILAETTSWNEGSPPDIVWAIAGAAKPTLFLDASIDTLKSQMDLNYWAAAYLAHATLKQWLVQDSGKSSKENKTMASTQPPLPRHFIMTASVIAFLGLAGYTPYAPAKAALRSLHDQLTSEMNLYNAAFAEQRKKLGPASAPPDVHTHIVFPGTILSPGLETENSVKHPITKILEEGDQAQTPEEAAKGAIDGLERGQSMVTTQALMGEAIKSCGWAGSVRDRPVYNIIMAWILSLAWPFITMDFQNKVRKYGRENGVPQHSL